MKKILAGLALSLLLIGGCAQPQQQNLAYIGSEQAKARALEAAGLNGAAFSDVTLDARNGLDYYSVVFTADGQVYEYDIDALTGTVIENKVAPAASSAASASGATLPETISGATPEATPPEGAISVEEAKRIALEHAGVSADGVSMVKARLDEDDGRMTYDVEFYTPDGKEYDYEIDPATGEVISYDFDAEAYTSSATGSSITADRAKEIALAAVPGASAADVWEFETDHEDGRLVYEGKVVYDGRKYEFEIDGYSGAIRSWESEPVRR